MAVDKLASEHFKRTQGASRHVVVDFYADRRGPCRQVAPALEELSSKWDGEVRFVQVNIDESPQLTATYRIFSIPTIILFQNGTVTPKRSAPVPSARSNLISNDNGHTLMATISTPPTARDLA